MAPDDKKFPRISLLMATGRNYQLLSASSWIVPSSHVVFAIYVASFFFLSTREIFVHRSSHFFVIGIITRRFSFFLSLFHFLREMTRWTAGNQYDNLGRSDFLSLVFNLSLTIFEGILDSRMGGSFKPTNEINDPEIIKQDGTLLYLLII